jgi:hypothetical protein
VHQINRVRNVTKTLKPAMEQKGSQCGECPRKGVVTLNKDAAKRKRPHNESHRVPLQYNAAPCQSSNGNSEHAGTSGRGFGVMLVKVITPDPDEKKRKLRREKRQVGVLPYVAKPETDPRRSYEK